VEKGEDLYAAIDRMVDPLKVQLKRYRERPFVGGCHPYQGPPPSEVRDMEASRKPEEEGPRIARVNRQKKEGIAPEASAREKKKAGERRKRRGRNAPASKTHPPQDSKAGEGMGVDSHGSRARTEKGGVAPLAQESLRPLGHRGDL